MAATAAPTELVANGSFESNLQSASTWHQYISLTGWTENIDPNGVELRNDVGGKAFDGSNYIELDTFANSSISQNIDTAAGQNYNLRFSYSPRARIAANSNGIEVFWNGTSQGIFTGDGIGNTGNVWIIETLSLAGGGGGLLSFKAVGQSDAFGGSLDAVSVMKVTAVPEPETYAMMLAGLGILGYVTRRRKAL